MKLTTLIVTPAIAAEMLARNKLNRPLSSYWVFMLASAMKAGEWKLNGEAIKIDTNGDIIDGQHRLHAIIKSGRAIPLCVIEDLPTDIFDTLDQGKRRSAADVLAIGGAKNSCAISSALRVITFLEGTATSLTSVRTPLILDAFERHPDVAYWVSMFTGLQTLRAIAPSSLCGVVTLGAESFGQDSGEFFMRKLSSGEMLAEDSPILVLRQRLIEAKKGSARLASLPLLTIIVKAWNAYATGRKIKILRYKSDEAMPKMAEPYV